MKKPHSNFQPGKRLLVLMRNGEHFIDKFKDRSDRYVEFHEHGRVYLTAIRAIQIPK